MPIMSCRVGDKPGYKYGDTGHCYSYTPKNEVSRKAAKRKAVLQGTAIEVRRKRKLELAEGSEDLLERLAEREHQQWIGWTAYMLDNFTPENIRRWRRQIKTSYSDLTESEKESDRKEARKVLSIMDGTDGEKAKLVVVSTALGRLTATIMDKAARENEVVIEKEVTEADVPAVNWAHGLRAYLIQTLRGSRFDALNEYSKYMGVNKEIRKYSLDHPLKEEWRDRAVLVFRTIPDCIICRLAGDYVDSHAGLLIKIEHGERLPEEIWEGVKDGEPLAATTYKAWSRYKKEPGWQRGWAQFHWRGMKEKKASDIVNHSVHCDLRLTWGGKLIEWVLTGKQDKLIRALRGTNDPSTSQVQNCMAVVKPSDEKKGETLDGAAIIKAELLLIKARHRRDRCMECTQPPTVEVLWANGHGHAWFCASCYKKWLRESDWHEVDSEKKIEHGIARMKLSERTSPSSLRKGEGVIEILKAQIRLGIPMIGYWMEPQEAENPYDTWAFMQVVDEFEWFPGTNRRDAHEIFIRGSKYGVVKGRFVLRALAGGAPRQKPGEPGKEVSVYWMFSRPEDQKAMDPQYHKDDGTVIPIKVWRVRRPK